MVIKIQLHLLAYAKKLQAKMYTKQNIVISEDVYYSVYFHNRFVVGQHVTLQDDVVSHLNISRVTEQDGGEYACVASNTAGKASHAARVNVYGLPYIREMPKVTAVAGSDLNIKCPVAGYPIESITWERG